MNVNFAFIRHGYGCHNAMSNLVNANVISSNDARNFLSNKYNSNELKLTPLNDPELTPIGVDASINNGCVISKILKSIYKITGNKNLKIDKMNIVGCSPLIRCMETAYYMTRKWNNPPDKIYVFPLLREIDESSSDKYSQESLDRLKTIPSYSIKTISEQKEYLRNLGILDVFDFSFVESFPNLRIEPGDVRKFINWFNSYFIPFLKSKNNLNVFIVTHAGVLKDFSNEGFVNNSGFLLNIKFNPEYNPETNPQYKPKFDYKDYISFNPLLPNFFFKDYSNNELNGKKYYCPSNRCGQLCTIAKGPSSSKKQSLNLKCSIDNEDL